MVEGDVASDLPNLSLGPDDQKLLIETCTHIYHVAAFISFAAHLQDTLKINLKGSQAVLHLARQMKRLKSMVHVSTAYLNCVVGSENSTFEEKIYPIEVDPVEVLESVR